jgi:hypothetical protein
MTKSGPQVVVFFFEIYPPFEPSNRDFVSSIMQNMLTRFIAGLPDNFEAFYV